MVQLSHPFMTTGKTIPLTKRTFVCRVNSPIAARHPVQSLASSLLLTFVQPSPTSCCAPGLGCSPDGLCLPQPSCAPLSPDEPLQSGRPQPPCVAWSLFPLLQLSACSPQPVHPLSISLLYLLVSVSPLLGSGLLRARASSAILSLHPDCSWEVIKKYLVRK